jgi:cytochrome P450
VTAVNESPTTRFGRGELIWGDDAQEWWGRMGQGEPVIEHHRGVMVTSPQAVDFVLHHPEVFSSGPDAGFLGSPTGLIPLQVDPPDHARYRRLLDPLFGPKRMAALEPDVAALTNRLIDGFIERGCCDFCPEVAVPLPSGTFLRLMGLPLSDLAEFIRVKDAMIRPPTRDVEEANRLRAEAAGWVFDYYNRALDERRADPTDDILGHLARYENEATLTRDETLNISFLLLVAGLDTVTDTLECSFAFLARHPDHQRQLVSDPSLVPTAVEELLRWETPVPNIARVATTDAELEGCPIKKGQQVGVLLGSTNVDPRIFPCPTTVDFSRESVRHFAFGAGVHRCLGSHLARVELRVVLREWHRRIPEYRLADGHVVKYRSALREIASLPLVFAAGRPEGG